MHLHNLITMIEKLCVYKHFNLSEDKSKTVLETFFYLIFDTFKMTFLKCIHPNPRLWKSIIQIQNVCSKLWYKEWNKHKSFLLKYFFSIIFSKTNWLIIYTTPNYFAPIVFSKVSEWDKHVSEEHVEIWNMKSQTKNCDKIAEYFCAISNQAVKHCKKCKNIFDLKLDT